ncbi:hypothetical protein BJ322DRAFT_1110494 [Thelephora terrestris]|uniref:DUF6534 domain-containing protein n=1 Tax=Thelephora terrestris TaxID=56493 RepID=A0A9P6H9T1_9AGAM|nr:hypothetical protein BJ322DRAFT_1110494 [Thelephora terrestris]
MDQIPALDNTFGAALIGVIVASVLYGVSCSQVFYYFNHYSKKDGPATKAVVIAALVSDTVHQVLICHTVYSYLVKSFFQPAELGKIVWSLIIEVIFNGLTAFLVQTFFAIRIWKFSHRNIPITLTLSSFVLGEFVCVIVYVSRAIHMDTFQQLATLKPLSMTINVLAGNIAWAESALLPWLNTPTVAGDVLITIVFCFLLHRARNNLQRSNTMINLLIAFSVQTGMLTSLCAIASLISISLSPDTFIYICFYFLLGRLYCNSLLATLNVRNAIRGRGHDDLGISLRPIDVSDSNTSTVDNHKEIEIEIDVKTEAVGYVEDSEREGSLPSFNAHDHNRCPPLDQPISGADPRAIQEKLELESGGV